MEKKLKTQTTEKESIEKRFKMICAEEVKTVKKSNEDLKKEIKHISADLKNVRKEAKDKSKDYEKSLNDQEKTIQELQHFKNIRNSEEKELKSKQKKIDKKIKVVGEKEAKLKFLQKQVKQEANSSDENKNCVSNIQETLMTSSSTLTNSSITKITVDEPNLITLDLFEIHNTDLEASIQFKVDKPIEQWLTEAERNIRDKFRRSIKSKLETKLTDKRFSAEDIDIKELEDDLLAEMDDTIQEEIEAFKQHIESWDYSDASNNINGDEQDDFPYYVTGWLGEPDFKGEET